MSKRAVKVELLDGSKVLTGIDFEKGQDPILVGRSHECALRTPSEDHTISGKHVRLSWKGGKIVIEDAGSRNGVYADGRRIAKPQKVCEGVLYTLGNYRLSFNAASKKTTAKDAVFHRLKFLSGMSVGKNVRINAKDESPEFEFTIGLDHSCDLRLTDPSVSRKHAVLKVRKGGVCWIEDLGSRNGTYVNGEALKKERLLKNRDKISIAYFEFQYRNDPDKDLHLVAKLIAVSITAAILAIGYSVMNLMMPESEQYLSEADRFAKAEKFVAAERALDEVKKCRDAGTDDIKERVEEFRRKLTKWKLTCEGWEETKRLLGNGYVKDGRAALKNSLRPENQDGWAWNNEASTVFMAEATSVDEAIDLCYEAKDIVDDARDKIVSKEELLSFNKRLGNALADTSGCLGKPYMKHVVDYMMGFKESLGKIINRIEEVDRVVDGIDLEEPDFSDVIHKLKTVLSDGELASAIKNHVKKIVPIIERLNEAQKFLEKEKEHICDMDFALVSSTKESFPLPDKGECALSSKLSDLRLRMQEIHVSYLNVSDNLAPMVRNLAALGIRDGDRGALVNYVTSKSNWDKVLDFDCFKARFPRASRVDPTSVYDEMIGIEYTYANLRLLPDQPKRQTEVLMNFIPKTQTIKAAFGQVKTFLSFMERDGLKGFKAGKLGHLYALGADVISERDGLVNLLHKRTKQNGKMNRGEIIAGYYAEYFSDAPSYPELCALQMAFKSLQKEVNSLYEQYDAENDPEKRIVIGKKILEIGIPGMEAVRKIWVQNEE